MTCGLRASVKWRTGMHKMAYGRPRPYIVQARRLHAECVAYGRPRPYIVQARRLHAGSLARTIISCPCHDYPQGYTEQPFLSVVRYESAHPNILDSKEYPFGKGLD